MKGNPKNTKAVQPIQIELLYGEDCGSYWCRGHVDIHEFNKALIEQRGCEIAPDCLAVRWLHTWWRFTPIGPDGPGRYYMDTLPGIRGAFKVTAAWDSQCRVLHGDRFAPAPDFSEGAE